MATSKTRIICKLLLINKVDGIPNVRCTKIAEELDIYVQKSTSGILGQSGRGENV